ncbi:ABC transporter permease [Georgenia thermotolerans]|uniref:ABC transporter permease subunit n=1 Tax=Georgenia thermotolerans TaxID=527326 RepID=A0A7J5URG0_9MICO|nr:ABC transporter permease [Georgenia thermotolerans]KAE8764917.1 ABC transporter permease subunit [Georgenia thermotolerans]
MDTLYRTRRWLGRNLVVIVAIGVLAYMLLPNAVVALLSFNKPASRLSYDFEAFTLDNWLNPCAAGDMCAALATSFRIGFVVTLVATLLGTLMSFAMVRHRYRGQAATSVLIYLPMATPEVVMGSSLLTLFVAAGVPLGTVTVAIAHVMFCLSFVVVTVKARLTGLDPRLEQAAMDLYANEWETFRRVTLPLVAPGIAAAAMLSFALSFDDFVITNFNSGTTVTFPMYVWGSAQRGVPMQVNVVGTAMFAVALLVLTVGEARRRRAGRR